ncbi:hypothetical protein RXV95_13300 [Novosphingobium sp. ZN18A2]|uniref:hypothetical protein n=1 Tax=Novosphingobium sp. ZN18A2 TaxID=3079861 RepID=UPI0030D5CFD1
MTLRSTLAISTILMLGAAPCTVSAQDAAESAMILSGTGQGQASSARSLGSSIANSMNAASREIRTQRASGNASGRAHYRRRTRGVARTGAVSAAIPANADMLKGTDAPTYKLGNGASIRVSGGLVQAPTTSCVKDCPKPPN